MTIDNGLFIVFEGVDGSGKTTQFQRLQQHFRAAGIEPLMVREPGGTEIGEGVREILLSHKSTGMSDRAEMLLFCSSRAQLVAEKILPTLQNGGVVIADRYRLSTEIYQGIGRGLPLEGVTRTLDFATQELLPQITFLLDLTFEQALQRKQAMGVAMDRMETAGEAFYRKIQSAFVNATGIGYVHIDANQPIEVIETEICREVMEHDWWQRHIPQ